MTSKKLAILSLLAVFVFGFVVGVAVTRFFYIKNNKSISRAQYHDAKIVDKFSRELNLTEAQRAQLIVLLERIKKQHDEIRKSIHPEFERVREEFKNSFSALLTDEQKTKFLELDQCDSTKAKLGKTKKWR